MDAALVLPDRRLVARAKTTLARWIDGTDATAADRRAVLAAFDRLPVELLERDSMREVRAGLLPNTEGVRATWTSDDLHVAGSSSGLIVGTRTPCWSGGWASIATGGAAYETIAWLMRFARQYVERSLALRVVSAVRRSAISHVFATKLVVHRNVRADESAALARAVAQLCATRNTESGRGARRRFRSVRLDPHWLNSNLLDPHLHRATFELIRADRLRLDGYGAESVVQYDSALVLLEEWIRRSARHSVTDRAAALRVLGLGRLRSVGLRASFLRNHFGAHSGGWRWWDFSDMFGEDVDRIARLASRAVDAAIALEPAHRRIDPAPRHWSKWFWENFQTLWDAIWFEQMLTHPR